MGFAQAIEKKGREIFLLKKGRRKWWRLVKIQLSARNRSRTMAMSLDLRMLIS